MAGPVDEVNALLKQMAVEKVAEDVFISKEPPARMGNKKSIAYGGCTRAFAMNAASQTVKTGFNLYSCLGFFLGPARIDRSVKCTVYRIRETKSFATRRVVVSQTLPDGSERRCLEVTADFQATEPAAFMVFQPAPLRQYQMPPQVQSKSEARDHFIAGGMATEHSGTRLDDMFILMSRCWEQKPCPEGVSGQNLLGFAKHLTTDQDHLPIVDKVSAEWYRAKGDLPTTADQVSALAFNMDGGLAFIPLIHDHKYLEDVGACSSLDFALRVFSNSFDLTKWHLKERKAIAGEGGRTYSEARLFDEAGNLVAIESQQSIMRPPPTKQTVKL
ncbi:acyl-CoA thioesterase II [Cyphellophora europaea CBS 101466]|uniref:Acyl-CoA thioesterase II n=1 Tax=Cyphellophora europaea (strain CBS 101466) TaxID=1220924 RepID=W2SBA8_CYPE1|nr:acyl-CoA thioesterase II [Cyphellophora europaea CBS 101466]ETN45313.1 acyl-CoA thioesterase II [Cyphellophora europaea CBS 101466]